MQQYPTPIELLLKNKKYYHGNVGLRVTANSGRSQSPVSPFLHSSGHFLLTVIIYWYFSTLIGLRAFVNRWISYHIMQIIWLLYNVNLLDASNNIFISCRCTVSYRDWYALCSLFQCASYSSKYVFSMFLNQHKPVGNAIICNIIRHVFYASWNTWRQKIIVTRVAERMRVFIKVTLLMTLRWCTGDRCCYYTSNVTVNKMGHVESCTISRYGSRKVCIIPKFRWRHMLQLDQWILRPLHRPSQ